MRMTHSNTARAMSNRITIDQGRPLLDLNLLQTDRSMTLKPSENRCRVPLMTERSTLVFHQTIPLVTYKSTQRTQAPTTQHPMAYQ